MNWVSFFDGTTLGFAASTLMLLGREMRRGVHEPEPTSAPTCSVPGCTQVAEIRAWVAIRGSSHAPESLTLDLCPEHRLWAFDVARRGGLTEDEKLALRWSRVAEEGNP